MKTNIPKLRFIEFKDAPDWEEKKLGEVANRITRRNTSNCTNVLTISAQHGLVSQTDYFNKIVASKDLSNYYHIKRNEFAYNKSYSAGYPLGAIKRLTEYDEGVLSSLYICFDFINKKSQEYYENYFESTKWHKEVYKIMAEGARNHGLLNIPVNDFFSIKLNQPKYTEEQEKVGKFLSTLDKRIELQEKLIEKLEEEKKGYLQKLFPKKGKNIPELRFGEFKDAGEWEEKTLRDLIELTIDNRGKTPPVVEGEVPLIEVNALESNGINYNKISKSVSKDTYSTWFREHIKAQDLLFTTVGNTAQCAIYDGLERACIAQNIVAFRFNSFTTGTFMDKLFKNAHNYNRIKAIEMIAVQPSIKVTQLKEMKFLLCCMDEQEIISKLLDRTSRTIILNKNLLQSLHVQKKFALNNVII